MITRMLFQKTSNETKSNISDSVYVRYVVAVIAAWAAEAGLGIVSVLLVGFLNSLALTIIKYQLFPVSYPFDLTKTRLQVQNEIASAKHGFKMESRGMVSTALYVARHEGVHKLWCGMIAMWQRHFLYSGCRIVFYERLRNLCRDEAGNVTIIATAVCGITAGALAQTIASPTDLVKIQMQCEGRRIMQGKKPRFKGSLGAYKMIYKESGVLGFWRGVIPNAQRAALTTVGTIAGYDYSKRFFKKTFHMPEGVVLHTCSAFISGFMSAVLGTPADVIKTRLMHQPIGKDGKGQIYKGYFDCVRQTLKNEGLFSLYKGFLPVWMRLGPWGLVNWLVFENIMRSIGGSAF